MQSESPLKDQNFLRRTLWSTAAIYYSSQRGDHDALAVRGRTALKKKKKKHFARILYAGEFDSRVHSNSKGAVAQYLGMDNVCCGLLRNAFRACSCSSAVLREAARARSE